VINELLITGLFCRHLFNGRCYDHYDCYDYYVIFDCALSGCNRDEACNNWKG